MLPFYVDRFYCMTLLCNAISLSYCVNMRKASFLRQLKLNSHIHTSGILQTLTDV